jgi:hypothetical protein
MKRAIRVSAPKGTAAWNLPDTHSAPALQLWARANRLKNELGMAEDREQALAAAVRFLRSVPRVSKRSAVAKVAVTYLAACSTPRFAVQAIKHATAQWGGGQ